MAGGVFAVREFRFVWAAEVLSIAGDQLARVALAVLVFDRTASAAWAAGVYALTFLPALLGGVLLGGLADRHPRREVMVAADLMRALLVTAMATPGLPLPGLATLLVIVVVLGSPFTAAQGALLPEVLPGPLYERGLAVRQITSQSAQLLGFATGGLLVATVSPATALLLDAATFLTSAALLRTGLTRRPPAHHSAPPHRATPRPATGSSAADRPGADHSTADHSAANRSAAEGPVAPSPAANRSPRTGPAADQTSAPGPSAHRSARNDSAADRSNAPSLAVDRQSALRPAADRSAAQPLAAQPSGTQKSAAGVLGSILRDEVRRRALALAWLVGCFVVPEALAAPYAAAHGGGAAAVGLLMAADPLGSIVGVWVFVRLVPEKVRRHLTGVLAVAAGLPLLACLGDPPVPVAAALFGLSGMFSTSYLLQAQADFVRATPDSERGRAIGLASAGLIAGQGVAVLAGGLLAEATGPATAIALAGLAGMALSAPFAVTGARRQPSQ